MGTDFSPFFCLDHSGPVSVPNPHSTGWGAGVVSYVADLSPPCPSTRAPSCSLRSGYIRFDSLFYFYMLVPFLGLVSTTTHFS